MFQQGDVVPSLPEIVHGFAHLGPWVTLDFLLAPDTAPAVRTPLQTLWDGDQDAVLRSACGFRADDFGRGHRSVVGSGAGILRLITDLPKPDQQVSAVLSGRIGQHDARPFGDFRTSPSDCASGR
jgi:hypothetical protein